MDIYEPREPPGVHAAKTPGTTTSQSEKPPASATQAQPAGRQMAWMWTSDGKPVGAAVGLNSAQSGFVGRFDDVASIACSSNGGYLVRRDGTVWAWGHNGDGRLGDGTREERGTPVRVKDLTDVKAVAGKWAHAVALKQDGTVWAWGGNERRQLGDGTRENRLEPVQVRGIADAIAVSSGI